MGGAIVRKLVERGDRVISFSRRFYPELSAMGVEQIQGDIRVSGLNSGDRVIVEIWVVLKSSIPTGVTGNGVPGRRLDRKS